MTQSSNWFLIATHYGHREQDIKHELPHKIINKWALPFPLCLFPLPTCTPSLTFPQGHSPGRTLGMPVALTGLHTHSWAQVELEDDADGPWVPSPPVLPQESSRIPVLAAQSCFQILQAPLGYQNQQWRIPRALNTFSRQCPVTPGINLFTSLWFSR